MILGALGLIEVIGLVPALVAADTCLKASNVHLIGYEKVTGGLVTVKIQGDVSAVKSAISAAKASAEKVGTVSSTLVIPRPATSTNTMISPFEITIKDEPNSTIENKPEATHPSAHEEQETIEELTTIEEQSDLEQLPEKASCNLCHDPQCPREKGQPRHQCIHYQDNKFPIG